MTRQTALFLLLFLCSAFVVNAQFEKANDLYSAKQYAAAIPYFEKGLLEKDNLSAKTRLANCYRLTNKMEQAEAVYATVVEQPKAKPDAFLHYAETLMNNGKYDRARQFFEQHFKLEPLDSTGFWMARNCSLVPGIRPYFPWVSIEKMPFNSDSDDNSAIFWRGGVVFTSDRPGGSALLKQKAGWTGRDYLKLWWVKCDSDTSFGEAKGFSGRLNILNKNTANATFTADGKRVFFTRNADFTGKDNTLNLQLFSAENTGGNRWKSGEILPFCTPEINYMHPAVAPDGSFLIFSTNKNGTLGGFDLWISKRKNDGGWSRPENLGPTINTPQHEGFPFIAGDGRLFFCSKGQPGFGGFDIFVSEKDSLTGLWAAPKNLGKPINGSHDDLGFSIAANDSIGFFTSSRDGDDDDIYLFWLGEKKVFPQVKKAEEVVVEAEAEEIQIIENQLDTVHFFKNNVDSLAQFLTQKLAVAGQAFMLENIKFDTSIAVVPDSASMFLDLEKLKKLFDENPDLKIEINVHTEVFSKEKLAQKISEARAVFLQKKLVERGVPAKQVSARGFGSKKPALPCPKKGDCPPEILRANRRVEILVLPTH